MKRRYSWIGLAALIIALAMAAYGVSTLRKGTQTKGPGDKGGFAPPVQVARVYLGTVSTVVDTVGSLQADESVIIRSEATGRVTGIHFTEGRRVVQGDLLVTIDPAEYLAQRDQVAATVTLNQLNFDRAKQLFEDHVISPQAFDEIGAKLHESQANLAFVQERLNKTSIRAPFAGCIGFRRISPGDYVQPGQEIVNLERIDPVKVDFRVSEVFLSRTMLGQTVTVRLDAYPDKSFTGRIYAIDPLLDEANRTIKLRARIANPVNELRPGMFAHVNLILDQRANAILIPEQAVVPMGEETFVYRIADGKAILAKVVTGQRRPGEVEIVKGLGPGDTVVTDGQMRLRDGSPVTIQHAQGVPPTQKPTKGP